MLRKDCLKWIKANAHLWACAHGFHTITTPDGELFAHPCNCTDVLAEAKKRKILRALSAIGRNIGNARYPAGCTLENFDWTLQPDLEPCIREVVRTFKRGLLLSGPVGTGKTHIAKAVMIEGIKREMTAAFYTAESLHGLFIQAQSNSDDGAFAKLRISKDEDFDILVVDDIGADRQANSDLFKAQFQDLLEGFRGTLIVTTNLDIVDQEAHCRKQIGERLFSRICELCEAIPFQGPDYRASNPITAPPPTPEETPIDPDASQCPGW